MSAADRHRSTWESLVNAVGDTPGSVAPTARRALIEGRSQTGALGAFAVKVSQNAASITDENVRKLVDDGNDEDAVFETIIAAAVGAAQTRMTAGLQALERKR